MDATELEATELDATELDSTELDATKFPRRARGGTARQALKFPVEEFAVMEFPPVVPGKFGWF